MRFGFTRSRRYASRRREEPDNLALDRYILSLWQNSDREPRVCFIPTASGDSADYIGRFYSVFEKSPCRPTHLSMSSSETADPIRAVSENDIFYVGGGNTRQMLGIWQAVKLFSVLILGVTGCSRHLF
jgi:dipeptidase E